MCGAGARLAASALLLLLCFRAGAGEYSSQSLSTFVDTMLAEYDREAPPAQRVAVTLALDVRHASVDDASATMRLLADLRMTWNDSRLTWNASAWSGDSVLVPAERLWMPDVELASAGGAHGGAGATVLRARLAAGGAVLAVQRLALSVPLALKLEAWPRDLHTAVFKFASRAYSGDELDLVIAEYKHSVVVESGAWEVVSVTGAVSQWQRGEDGVPAATWSVGAARRGAARAAAAGAVLAAAAVVLLAAAAQPYAQRPPLAAAASFIAAIWLVTAVFHLPSGAATPQLVRLMCAVCTAGAAAGAAATAAARLAARAAPPPQALRALLSRVSAIYTLAPDPESPCGGGGGGGGSGHGAGRSVAWAAAAQLLDAVAVALLVLTVLVVLGIHLLL